MNLTLYLTFDCNQRCRYCFTAPNRRNDMSLETAVQAIAVAAEATTQNGDDHLGVRFFGGEPLLRWEVIPTLVEETRRICSKCSLRPSFSISTNGVLLAAEQRDYFLLNDIAVGISIDGTQTAHDRNRLDQDGHSSYGLILENAGLAIEGDLRVELVLVVDPSTIDELPASVRYLRDKIGADFFILSFNIDAEWQRRDLEALASSYRELGDFYIEQFVAGRPVQIDALNNKINVLLRGGFVPEGLCLIGKTDLAVTPDGLVFPCLRIAAKQEGPAMAIGRVATGLNRDATTRLRSVCQPEQKVAACVPCRCDDCRHSDACLNWCVAANLATSGSPLRPGEVMCQHERISIGVAKRVIRSIDIDAYRELYREYLPSMGQSMRPHAMVGHRH